MLLFMGMHTEKAMVRNSTDPYAFLQLQAAYADRRAAITKCVRKVEADVEHLRQQRNQNRDDEEVKEKLSEAHMKVRPK